ncbi:uncharacterized protein si:rp71-17i16.6 isoform X2 [Electrophorus electricus]|uniref:uncharacterized protein si:rp71-17i16.6 isoform X2 n=1 Tax=Electrophorus electricus TaxID=8005 RepID=UPI0015CF8ED1|nr:uncharacterized protein si:rp71-17i16.6 isoform X2 [Electrophorus electricus]
MTEQNTEKHRVEAGRTSVLGDSHTNYQQYLHSLFGESAAEYFISPSSPPKTPPIWYTEMKNNMRDHVSAEAFWDALRERSTRILREMETRPSEADRITADWRKLMRQDHLQHLSVVRFMFHSALRNQAFSALLLNQRPPSFLFDLDMTEGSSRYTAVRNKQLTE